MKQFAIRFPLMFALLATINFFSQEKKDYEGRWDLEMNFEGKTVPSWLEIKHSGHETLVGRFVFAFGSARPISEINYIDGAISFDIPRQWEPVGNDMGFTARLKDGVLQGTMTYVDGNSYVFTGIKAPLLVRSRIPEPTGKISLFNGKDLSGWHVDRETSQWVVNNGILTSPESGANLISDASFDDFVLEAEFKYPKDGNSGIYLRGRYEVQIADNKGLEPLDIYFGGIYGFLEPNENAAKNAGEWQHFKITLIGRRVTVVANGKVVISDQTIPGITGGALDSAEGEAGPIMIQGDHAPIQFRKIDITPLR